MKELIQKLVDERYTIASIELGSGVAYGKLWRCLNQGKELKESDITKLQTFARKVGVLK